MSDECHVDLNLKLKLNKDEMSWEKIEENLRKHVVKNTCNRGILDMEPYPSPLILAKLAKAAYSDSDADLPQGWECLTIAFNKFLANGYFGAAYWCPSLQQVVIAHRGTDITNIGALLADLKICRKEYPAQMHSANTFADKIMTILQKVNQENGVSLQLSVTGHSLGGWLAQTTAFTLNHLQCKDGDFIKRPTHPPSRHVHTVTFDTPGCKGGLNKMVDEFCYRRRKTIFPERLDITNYLTQPNWINTCGLHVGTIYMVSVDKSNLGIFYTMGIHKIDNFVKAFEGEPMIREVLDWPLSTEEYDDFHSEASKTVEKLEQLQKKWGDRIRFRIEDSSSSNSCNLRCFSEKEIYLLELCLGIKAQQEPMTGVSTFLENNNLGIVDNLFENLEKVEMCTVSCSTRPSLLTLVKRTKQLMRWFYPEFLVVVQRQSQQIPSNALLIYRMLSRYYLDSLPEFQMQLKDTIELKIFLESETRILHIEAGDSQFEAARLYTLLSQMLQHESMYLRDDRQTFIDDKKIRDLENFVDFKSLYKSGYLYDNLLVIVTSGASIDLGNKEKFEYFFNSEKKKLIIIASPQSDCKTFCESLKVSFKTLPYRMASLNDLTEDSQKELFKKKMLIVGEKEGALEDYTVIENVNKILVHINEYTDIEMFKGIVTNRNFTIKMEGENPSHDDLNVHSKLNSEVTVAKVAQVLREHSTPLPELIISGISQEDLKSERWKELVSLGEQNISPTMGDGEPVFKQRCRDVPDSAVYWFAASEKHFICKTIYEKGFYMIRRLLQNRFTFDIEKYTRDINKDTKKQKAIFTFLDVEDRDTLMTQLNASEKNKQPRIYLRSENIKMVASPEEADGVIKKNPKRPVHVMKQDINNGPNVWQRSRGSLEGLRPYVNTHDEPSISEEELCKTIQKVVIIADEPGMGKSTSLTSLSRLLRPAWVIRVDLKDFHKQIKNLPGENQNLNLESVCNFILGEGEKGWRRGLLQYCLDKEHENCRKIFIFFDGFDEIKEESSNHVNEDKVLRLLKYLNEETTAKVWVTTRQYKKETVEDAVSVFAVQFEKNSEDQQREYLVNFWRPHLLLELNNLEESDLEKCAEYLYTNAKESLGDDIQKFMGIPLQMRMLAEVFMNQVKVFVESDTDIGNIFNVKSVLDLYQRFTALKYDIYFREKRGVSKTERDLKVRSDCALNEDHRLLGVRTLFPEFSKEDFDDPEEGFGAKLCRVGLVQSAGDRIEKVEFIHRTLAEYFCADLVVFWFNKRGKHYGRVPMMQFLLNKILLQDDYYVIRIFINNLVLTQPLDNKVRKFISEEISNLWPKEQGSFVHDKKTALHVAVQEGNTGIINILVGSLEFNPDRLISFVGAPDANSDTALGLAARNASNNMAKENDDNKKIIKNSNMAMKEIIRNVEACSHKTIIELLLATYEKHKSVFEDGIKLLSDYLEEDEAPPKTKKAYIRTKKLKEDIPIFLAAVRERRVDYVEKLYCALEDDTERNYVLLAKDDRGDTALHIAAQDKFKDEHKKIIEILCDRNIPEVGQSYNRQGWTPLHLAAEAGNLDTVQHLIKQGVHVDSRSETSRETPLFSAARNGRLPVVEYLVRQRSDIRITNKDGETALHHAEKRKHHSVVKFLNEMSSPHAQRH